MSGTSHREFFCPNLGHFPNLLRGIRGPSKTSHGTFCNILPVNLGHPSVFNYSHFCGISHWFRVCRGHNIDTEMVHPRDIVHNSGVVCLCCRRIVVGGHGGASFRWGGGVLSLIMLAIRWVSSMMENNHPETAQCKCRVTSIDGACGGVVFDRK
jgi:hypothetical protein